MKINLRKIFIEKLDLFSFVLGIFITDLSWAIQPKSSQSRWLIENGYYSQPFEFTVYILSFFLVIIIFWRIVVERLKRKKEKRT